MPEAGSLPLPAYPGANCHPQSSSGGEAPPPHPALSIFHLRALYHSAWKSSLQAIWKVQRFGGKECPCRGVGTSVGMCSSEWKQRMSIQLLKTWAAFLASQAGLERERVHWQSPGAWCPSEPGSKVDCET